MNLGEALELARVGHFNRLRSGEGALACARRVVTEIGPATPVGRVGRAALAGLVASLRNAGLAAGTVNRHLSALRSVLNVSLQEGHLKSIPPFPWCREPRGRTVSLTVDQVEQLVEACEFAHPTVGPLVLFLAETGLRAGEALGLRWGDVAPGRVNLKTTKNGDPRSVPLTERASAVLTALAERREGPFRAVSQSTLNHTFRAARESLAWARGNREVCPHALRHSCATRLVQAGVSLPVVGLWLGHRDIGSTMRYVHPNFTGLEAAARLLEK